MKGLLLKDWYMMKKYCRIYLLVSFVFIMAFLASDDNIFFLFYPCLLCSISPSTLLSYDESSGWLQYSSTLPYTKAQIVIEKYLIGLLSQLTMLAITAIAKAAKMIMTGSFTPGNYIFVILLILITSLLLSSVSFPFLFKFGTEQGKIIYYVMLGCVCGAAILVSKFTRGLSDVKVQPHTLMLLLTAASIGIYILSCYLSVMFFKKREI